jgi:polar amino acid transport system substrate-binding protein
MLTSFRKAKELLIGYILSIARAIDSKDSYTRGHSERVAYLSVFLAEKLGLGKEAIQTILIAGLLHDVGKIGIPEAIISKKGKLTEEEYEIVKQHTIKGEQIVASLDPGIGKIIRHHHEKWNGKGYPDGLKGEEIPFYSRILAVVDVFDALTSDRPYRKAYSFEMAVKIIEEEKGTQFDPEVVEPFLSFPKESLIEAVKNPDIISLVGRYIS